MHYGEGMCKMNKFKFSVGGTEFTIQDLGSDLNKQFVQLHEHFLAKQPFNYLDLDVAAQKYFASHPRDFAAHDAFFNNFTIIWRWLLELGHYVAAEEVWEFAMAPAIAWENAHPAQRLHKGTPYYFRGMTVILRGDLDRGFLLMHQALAEDIETFQEPLPNTPSSAFATLDYQKQDQAFRNEVQDTATFLDELLVKYRHTRRKSLTLDEFRNRFFNTTELRDPIFLFVFALFKLKTLLKKVTLGLRTNDFAGLLESGLLFDICLVVDSAIHCKNPASWKFIDHVAYLSSASLLDLNQARLSELNNAFRLDFANTINNLLAGTWKFSDGLAPSEAEVDVALTYGIRNLSAHRVQSIPVMYNRFEDISQRTMNTLFLVVESLY